MNNLGYLFPWEELGKQCEVFSRRVFGGQQCIGLLYRLKDKHRKWVGFRYAYISMNDAMLDWNERLLSIGWKLIAEDEVERFEKLEVLI
jgi:hypothetical protein